MKTYYFKKPNYINIFDPWYVETEERKIETYTLCFYGDNFHNDAVCMMDIFDSEPTDDFFDTSLVNIYIMSEFMIETLRQTDVNKFKMFKFGELNHLTCDTAEYCVETDKCDAEIYCGCDGIYGTVIKYDFGYQIQLNVPTDSIDDLIMCFTKETK